MASDAPPHHPNIFTEEELDDDDDEENDAVTRHLGLLNPNPTIMTNNNNDPDLDNPRNDADEDDDVDVDDDDIDDDSTSSTDPPIAHHLLPPMFPPTALPTSTATATSAAVNLVTVAVPILDQRLNDVTIATASTATPTSAALTLVEEKKPPFPIDESRKLFQRLWTDEDEIELLQGFLEYTTQRGSTNQHHHDTTAFYDQIKSKLQLDFNKNQLVEKLRRLKKKYRNVMQKIGSGKEYLFKSPHDQATFEISKKIWSGSTGNSNNNFNNCSSAVKISQSADEGGLNLNDDDDPSPNPNINFSSGVIDYSPNPNGVDGKIPIRSRKRPRGASVGGGGGAPFGGGVNIAAPQPTHPQTPVSIGVGSQTATATAIPNVIEETVRSCLSPIFKELLNGVMNLSSASRGVGGLAALSTMPLGLGGFGCGGVDLAASGDERWRRQKILELEVFSRRLELVQDEIKLQLEELRAKESMS